MRFFITLVALLSAVPALSLPAPQRGGGGRGGNGNNGGGRGGGRGGPPVPAVPVRGGGGGGRPNVPPVAPTPGRGGRPGGRPGPGRPGPGRPPKPTNPTIPDAPVDDLPPIEEDPTEPEPEEPAPEDPEEPAPGTGLTECATTALTMSLPEGQTALVEPDADPSFVFLGVGTQNYTCSDAGKYVSAGAVADLFDVSCDLNSRPSEVVGHHYFITNPAGGISPKWDLTSAGPTAGDANAFVLAAKTGNIPSPDGSTNVDWLALKGNSGGAATQVFRTDTVGGQPPASCEVGSAPITVPYESLYFLYGATL